MRGEFLLDGRRLDKIRDFRFRERRFPLMVFDSLSAVDARHRFSPPLEQLENVLAGQERLRLERLRDTAAFQLHVAQASKEASQLHMDHAACDERAAAHRSVLLAGFTRAAPALRGNRGPRVTERQSEAAAPQADS